MKSSVERKMILLMTHSLLNKFSFYNFLEQLKQFMSKYFYSDFAHAFLDVNSSPPSAAYMCQ